MIRNKKGNLIWVSDIKPEAKDIKRARDLANLRGKSHDEDAPFSSNASKMAKLIKDKEKLVRRAKAIAGVWGIRDYEVEIKNKNGFTRKVKENVWTPFAIALDEAGISITEIFDIARYEHDDPTEVLGIDDLFL